MKNLIIVGDVHGKFYQFSQLLWQLAKTQPDALVIQVGDLGLGFARYPANHDGSNQLDNIPIDWCFIRGNHDEPVTCRQHAHYLGEWGILPLIDPQGQEAPVFYVSGAYSIDQHLRLEGVSWFRDEQLSQRQLLIALDAYQTAKPTIMLTHDCPVVAAPKHVRDNLHPNRTQQALDAMFELWQPDLWVFGHHHVVNRPRVGKTQFIGLAELEAYPIW